jgi:hypothetical protein
MADDEHLGPLLRLWGLTTAQLPTPSDTPDALAPFLISVLQEAVPFIDSISSAPEVWKSKGSKKQGGSVVHLSQRVVAPATLHRIANRSSADTDHTASLPTAHAQPETWICRRSLHADMAGEGSASWGEFRGAMKERHAQSEQAFTTGVVAARPDAVVWDCGAVEAEEAGRRWGCFTLALQEMRHRAGHPVVKDRVFALLQMTAAAMEDPGDDSAAAISRREKPEFIVVNIPVVDMHSSQHGALVKEKDVVVGAYVSVERFSRLHAHDPPSTEWIMATASDARGALPMWLQTMAVPGAISKDVPMFLTWMAKERQTQDGNPEVQGENDTTATNGQPEVQAANDTTATNGKPEAQAANDPTATNGNPEVKAANDTTDTNGNPEVKTADDTAVTNGHAQETKNEVVPPPAEPVSAT